MESIPTLAEANRPVRARQNGAPTCLYELVWRTPGDSGKWRASHGLDIPLAFDNAASAGGVVGVGPEARRLADSLSDAWIAFARTGSPNRDGSVGAAGNLIGP